MPKICGVLKHEDRVLDQYGAPDILQLPIAHFYITQGNEHLACVRRSQKGINRWYARCCNTPIGNTLGDKAPFIGVIHNFMQHAGSRDQALGKIQGYIHCQSASAQPPVALQASF